MYVNGMNKILKSFIITSSKALNLQWTCSVASEDCGCTGQLPGMNMCNCVVHYCETYLGSLKLPWMNKSKKKKHVEIRELDIEPQIDPNVCMWKQKKLFLTEVSAK